MLSAGLSFVETSACESTNVDVAFKKNLTDVYHIISKVNPLSTLVLFPLWYPLTQVVAEISAQAQRLMTRTAALE